MANKVQRIGFIGISGRGSGMLDLLLQVDGVVVPAVCDLIVERAEEGIKIVEGRNNKEYPVKLGKEIEIPKVENLVDVEERANKFIETHTYLKNELVIDSKGLHFKK